MQIKKSQLYSSIWAACDELRGGMDASQYKDYVLVLLFVRYVSDKYQGNNGIVEIPEGGSFADMLLLKGKKDIGEGINKVLAKLAEANELKGVIDAVNFDDDDKLGKDKEKVDRLTNLLAIFENDSLDFSKNRAEGDDLLGDAYEYLMKNFAAESGKSKGQFYTPAEVSRIMAKVLEVDKVDTKTPTAYDPTCGSGSLLLKVATETSKNISLYGQEKDIVTAGLAVLNMWLHGRPEAEIKKGQSTLSNPLFTNSDDKIKTFDFVVANPPFSNKNWTNGFTISEKSKNIEDKYERFDGFGIPPEKNGDYAFLLHIVKSLKSSGRGAVILPHGVLFRGNAEQDIRQNLLKRGYLKGIIGLPANLFYGTGIPACIILIDKNDAVNRKGIFMIDAKNGFVKDGNKNRLREQDIRKICDVWFAHQDVPHFARFVPNEEIEKNEYNLNIPRYIEATNDEIVQDIEAHLNGGIPDAGIELLDKYWQIAPSLKNGLFKPNRTNYSDLKISADDIRSFIGTNKEFSDFQNKTAQTITNYESQIFDCLKNLNAQNKPKEIITYLADVLLEQTKDLLLIDKYDLYQNLMTYWEETMQDDVYVIVADGWKAGNILTRLQNQKKKDIAGLAGLEGLLIPVSLLISLYFSAEKQAIDAETWHAASLQTEIDEQNENLLDDNEQEIDEVAEKIKKLKTEQKKINQKIKELNADLEAKVIAKYPKLTEAEIKDIVINKKWFATLDNTCRDVACRVSTELTNQIKALAARYEQTLPQIDSEIASLSAKVEAHLKEMGYERV